VRRFAVTARLRPEVAGKALELIAKGPPFDPAALGFERHAVYLSHGEIVFVFEGEEVEWILDEMASEEGLAAAFREWEPLIEGIPRLAREEFFWQREDLVQG